MSRALNCGRRQKGEGLTGGRPAKGIVRGEGRASAMPWVTSGWGEPGDTQCKARLFIIRTGPSSCLIFVCREEPTQLCEQSSATIKARVSSSTWGQQWYLPRPAVSPDRKPSNGAVSTVPGTRLASGSVTYPLHSSFRKANASVARVSKLRLSPSRPQLLGRNAQ